MPTNFLRLTASRNYSSLLVPLAPKNELPAELGNYELTNQEYESLLKEWEEMNNGAKEELKEMNQNRITNIIERGGVDNWETASDLAHLKRTFEFKSFE